MSELRLSYESPRPHVVARDPKRGVILLGGLGVLGVGCMWRVECESDVSRDGYTDAEIVDTGNQTLFGLV